MVNSNLHTTPASHAPSFGQHRMSDRPASAVKAGGSTLPAGWEADAPASRAGRGPSDHSPRSFADIALDPLRWITASRLRLMVVGVALILAAVSAIL